MRNLHPPKDVPGFGARLRAWRAASRFDLDSAGRLLGVSGSLLYTIERGIHLAPPSLLVRFEEVQAGQSIFTAPAVMRHIPILSWAQAGRATAREQMPEGWMDWLDCLCPDPKAFAVVVVGESMLPDHPPGAFAICMPNFPPKNNKLAVAKFQDESVTFKVVKFKGQRPATFRLEARNPKFPPQVVERDSLAWIYPVHSVVGQCAASCYDRS